MMRKLLICVFLLIIVFYGCSSNKQIESSAAKEEKSSVSSSKTEKNQSGANEGTIKNFTEDEIYVFDEPKPETIFFSDSVEIKTEFEFYIQLVAYADLNLARKAVQKFKKNFKKELHIHFNDRAALYVIRLGPFEDEQEAENEMPNVKKNVEFRDAFIVQVPKQ